MLILKFRLVTVTVMVVRVREWFIRVELVRMNVWLVLCVVRAMVHVVDRMCTIVSMTQMTGMRMRIISMTHLTIVSFSLEFVWCATRYVWLVCGY